MNELDRETVDTVSLGIKLDSALATIALPFFWLIVAGIALGGWLIEQAWQRVPKAVLLGSLLLVILLWGWHVAAREAKLEAMYTVYANGSGATVFHRDQYCFGLRNASEVVALDDTDALNAGMRPCNRCGTADDVARYEGRSVSGERVLPDLGLSDEYLLQHQPNIPLRLAGLAVSVILVCGLLRGVYVCFGQFCENMDRQALVRSDVSVSTALYCSPEGDPSEWDAEELRRELDHLGISYDPKRQNRRSYLRTLLPTSVADDLEGMP